MGKCHLLYKSWILWRAPSKTTREVYLSGQKPPLTYLLSRLARNRKKEGFLRI
jgi:hypothetical protein